MPGRFEHVGQLLAQTYLLLSRPAWQAGLTLVVAAPLQQLGYLAHLAHECQRQ